MPQFKIPKNIVKPHPGTLKLPKSRKFNQDLIAEESKQDTNCISAREPKDQFLSSQMLNTKSENCSINENETYRMEQYSPQDAVNNKKSIFENKVTDALKEEVKEESGVFDSNGQRQDDENHQEEDADVDKQLDSSHSEQQNTHQVLPLGLPSEE